MHLRFLSVLYWEQVRHGRYFVHEQPNAAASWRVSCMERLVTTPGVYRAETDQCASGLKSKDENGEGPAKKPAYSITNAINIYQRLHRVCPGYERHVWLKSSRTRAAQEYPRELCEALCQGTLDRASMDAAKLSGVRCCVQEADGEVNSIEHGEEDWIRYWDGISGAELPADVVNAARQDELDVIQKMCVWERRPKSECIARTGRTPIKLRWVDVNEGDVRAPKVRSGLVAKEIRTDVRPELFAATPPLEYIRCLISCCAYSKGTDAPASFMVVEVKKAYFFADAVREVYVELPAEQRGDSDDVGLLKQSLYGTQGAALNWANTYSRVLVDKVRLQDRRQLAVQCLAPGAQAEACGTRRRFRGRRRAGRTDIAEDRARGGVRDQVGDFGRRRRTGETTATAQ